MQARELAHRVVVDRVVEDESLPLPDNTVDRLLAVHWLEMAERIRPRLREIWRVLSPAGRVVIVRRDAKRPCLIAYETSYARLLHANIVARHADKTGEEREAAIQRDLRIFGRSEDLGWDVNGRIMLSDRLCGHIGVDPDAANDIDNKVCFFGVGETFEIWHAGKLAAWLEEDGDPFGAEDIRALIEEKRG